MSEIKIDEFIKIFTDYKSVGRIYPDETYNKFIKEYNKKIDLNNFLQEKIKNNETYEILDMMDEEVIQNYLLNKKIKRIKKRL